MINKQHESSMILSLQLKLNLIKNLELLYTEKLSVYVKAIYFIQFIECNSWFWGFGLNILINSKKEILGKIQYFNYITGFAILIF